jgi:hypothetical protein
MKHQTLKVMTNRRLNLSQQRISHGPGKVKGGHPPNARDSDSVCTTKPVDELELGVVSGVGGRRGGRSVALEQQRKFVSQRLTGEH